MRLGDLTLCVLLVCAACEGVSGAPGSGSAKLDVRPVAAFTTVKLSGGLGADIVMAEAGRVEITGDDNLVPLVTTQVTGDVLDVRTERSMRPKLPLVAHVATPRLANVELHGSGDIAIHGARGDSLKVGIDGSGAVQGDGMVGELRVEITGSGQIRLPALRSERVHVVISGSGNVEVTASQALDVEISGAGNVVYHGEPRVTKHLSGSGSVTHE